MNERWLPVVGYEGYYEVSDLGRVRSVDRCISGPGGYPRRQPGRLLTQKPLPFGHMTVNLWKLGVGRTLLVHRLVLLAFVGEGPDGTECCHNDGDPANNSVSNLRWDTRSENLRDRVRHGTDPWASSSTCRNGHLYTDATTARSKQGGRICRVCRAASYRRFQERRKAALA